MFDFFAFLPYKICFVNFKKKNLNKKLKNFYPKIPINCIIISFEPLIRLLSSISVFICRLHNGSTNDGFKPLRSNIGGNSYLFKNVETERGNVQIRKKKNIKYLKKSSKYL